MSILVLVILLVITGGAAFLFSKIREEILVSAVVAIVALTALGIFALNSVPDLAGGRAQPARAISVLSIAGLLIAASLVPLSSLPSRLRKKQKRKANFTVTRTPTLAGIAAKKQLEGATDLARYETMERVGIGGMATVYKARRKDDNRMVALKIPQDKFIADARFVRRFHREADVLMKLNHPNVVRVFEHNNEGTTHFIAMELIEGESLETLVETRRLNLESSVQVLKQVADALRYVHKQGIIHRDIKPGNIMVTRNALKTDPGNGLEPGMVKLMDFGIAAGRVLTRLTMTGARVGTPVYMSPEQARGNRIDHRTDIYSLGLVLYEMTTGQTAFKGGYEAVVQAQIFQTPTPPRQINLEVPAKLNDLVMRMIEKDPEKRPTLNEVIELIDEGLFSEQAELSGPGHILVSLNTRKGPIRVLDFNGNLERSYGNIAQDGLPAAPVAIAADADLNIFIAIPEYRSADAASRLLRKLDKEGKEVLAFGNYGMKPGEFLYPMSLTVGSWGQLYVLDGENLHVSRFDFNGNFQGRFGGRGNALGLFDDPRAVVAGADGYVYILDYGNRRVQRFSPQGEFINRYSFKVRSDATELRVLDATMADKKGVTFIGDANTSKIRSLQPPKGTQGPQFTIEALTGEDSSQVLDLAVDHAGNLFAARRGGHLIRKFGPDGALLQTIETYSPIQSMSVYIRNG